MSHSLSTRRSAVLLILTSLSIAAFALASGSFLQWIVLWLIWGIFVLLVQSTLWSTAVASTFQASRGLALGLTMSGTAVAPDRKSTRLNSSHLCAARMPSSP